MCIYYIHAYIRHFPSFSYQNPPPPKKKRISKTVCLLALFQHLRFPSEDLVQELRDLPRNVCVRRVNEVVARARAVKVHLALGILAAQWISVLVKEHSRWEMEDDGRCTELYLLLKMVVFSLPC